MNYSAAELLMLVTGICAGFGGMVVAIITAWRTGSKVEESAKKTDGKVDTALVEVNKVHTLVNDRATKQDAKNDELQSQIRVLIATIAQLDQQRAVDDDRKSQDVAIRRGGEEERIRADAENKTSIKANVEVLKEDVKEVKTDVKAVKAEVIKKDE